MISEVVRRPQRKRRPKIKIPQTLLLLLLFMTLYIWLAFHPRGWNPSGGIRIDDHDDSVGLVGLVDLLSMSSDDKGWMLVSVETRPASNLGSGVASGAGGPRCCDAGTALVPPRTRHKPFGGITT